jgi:hypothetical protein
MESLRGANREIYEILIWSNANAVSWSHDFRDTIKLNISLAFIFLISY